MNVQPSAMTASDDPTGERVAMLFNGDEVYGIGTILKLYASGMPNISFVAPMDGVMVDWLRANGNQVDVVPGLEGFQEGGASLLTLLKMPGKLLRARQNAVRLDLLLRSRGIRIVHAHWRAQQIVAGFLRRYGYRAVWQINNTMNPRRLFGAGAKLNHALAKWGADLLLPASDAIGENWVGCGVPSITIHNAATAKFREPNQLPETPVRCLVAGRLEYDKGHHLAVAAVASARQAGFDVRLDVYGGPLENNFYANELRAQIAAASCEDAIRLMGFEPRLREKHQEYHLGFQCRITTEPCSLWVCEAMVDGLPLLAAANGGTPELVDDGVSGLLFKSGDAADLTEKMLCLLRDPKRMAEMRVQAFARGQQRYTLERFIRETIAAYATLPSGEAKPQAMSPV
jgi:glycosyltransferase involved in cell wall biosynthesis